MEYEFYDPYYFLESSKTAHYIVGYSAIWTLDDVAITDDLLNIFKTDDVECPTFFHGIMTWIYDNVTRPNTTIDSIPISPDMTLISEQLTVSMPFSVEISFLPVNPCSVKFPLHSYTIAAGDAVTHVVDAEMVIPDPDRRVRLKLVLSGVALDNSYNLTVTACNAITSNNITGCPTVTGPGTAAGLSSTDTAIVGGLLGPTFAIAVIIAVIIIVIIIVKSKKIQNKQYVGVVGKYIDTEVSGGHPPRGCTEITNTSSLTHAVNWESDAETESKLQSEIEYNPESETAPLITKGCSFDDKKGTIIINTRKLFNALKIDPSKIKQLKMKDNNYY